jgi:hypothetical protein
MGAAAGALVLSAGLLAASAPVRTDTIVRGNSLQAQHSISSLAMDGPLAAFVYEARPNCIEAWNVRSRGLVRFPFDGCISSPTGEDVGTDHLTVGGSQLLWTWYMSTLDDWQTVTSATTSATKPVQRLQ